MPAAPIIIVAAAEYGAAEVIGAAVADAVVGATVSSATATAIGSGVISGAITAAEGGSASDVLKSAVASGVGSGVSSELGGGITGAAGGAAASTAISGGSGSDIIRNAIASGATSGITGEIKEAFKEPVAGTGLKGTPSTTPTPTDQFGVQADYSFAQQPSTGFTDKVPTTGGQGLYGDPNVILPPSLSDYKTAPSQMKAGEEGTLTPRYADATSYVVPDTLKSYLPEKTSEPQQFTSQPQTYSTLGKGEESALRMLVGSGVSGLLKTPSTKAFVPSSSVIGELPTTGVSTGLGAARGAGEVESSETGGKRRNVWNEASLRLTDALGI